MTNSERITAHNARLAAMKETVAALPEAGGGGGLNIVSGVVTPPDIITAYNSPIVVTELGFTPKTVLLIWEEAELPQYVDNSKHSLLFATKGELFGDSANVLIPGSPQVMLNDTTTFPLVLTQDGFSIVGTVSTAKFLRKYRYYAIG